MTDKEWEVLNGNKTAFSKVKYSKGEVIETDLDQCHNLYRLKKGTCRTAFEIFKDKGTFGENSLLKSESEITCMSLVLSSPWCACARVRSPASLSSLFRFFLF